MATPSFHHRDSSCSHAVVIGSSIAGMLAGQVLARHFDRVTIVERDLAPRSAAPRKGVPQGRHIHLTLKSGADVISRLFPGLVEEMVSEGAVPITLENVRWHHYGMWKPRIKSSLIAYSHSRPFLEWKIRSRLEQNPRVHFLQGTEAQELVMDASRGSITAVRFQGRNRKQAQRELETDLVVDASGRGSKTPSWLRMLGFGQPSEQSVVINLTYASRLYKYPKGLPPNWLGLLVHPNPPGQTKGGVIASVENGFWITTLMGYFEDSPPTDEAGFLQYARQLDVPDLYDAMCSATPVTPISTLKFPCNLRRDYERMSSLPHNLVVLGDALCSFNPVYGQGMSVCAMSAQVLDDCLQGRDSRSRDAFTGFSMHYFKRVSKVIDTPWTIATLEDFRFPQAEGTRPAGTRSLNWYKSQLYELSACNPRVLEGLIDVLTLQHSPSVLFRPYVMYQGLKWGLGFREIEG
ncbi:MAG: hypothetical protein O2954_15245 [bacterium]|nr:hypothetical protein [bacterium]